MDIEFKIFVTTIISWIVIHCAAHPSTLFADWGERKFKRYSTFLWAIAIPHLVILISGLLYLVWK